MRSRTFLYNVLLIADDHIIRIQTCWDFCGFFKQKCYLILYCRKKKMLTVLSHRYTGNCDLKVQKKKSVRLHNDVSSRI